MRHTTHRTSLPSRLTSKLAAATAAALIALVTFASPSTASMGGNNTPVDPASLTPPVPAGFNATCFVIGNHISCSLAFSDPDVVNEPSGIICGSTELLFSQTRSVVGTRLYTADGLLLQRHFIETLNGNFTNPVTGKVALWTQHDTIIHNLAVPGDGTSGNAHVSGLETRVFTPGGGTIMSDTGTLIFADAGEGEPVFLSAHHPFFDYFGLGDTTAVAPLCNALA